MVVETKKHAGVDRAGLEGFAVGPVLGQGQHGTTWLAYLDFDGEADQVRVTHAAGDLRQGAALQWGTPTPVSDRGLCFPPALAATRNETWVLWVSRDDVGAPAQEATFSLWARPIDAKRQPSKAIRLAGGSSEAGRPYAVTACASDADLWVAYECWRNGTESVPGNSAEQPVVVRLHRRLADRWSDPVEVPVGVPVEAPEFPTRGSTPRMYDPSVAVDSNGTVHVAWWSPNGGEVWEQSGTRAGTTADALRRLPDGAASGHHDGGSTGSDVWYASFSPGSERDTSCTWSSPERLNATAGWHLHPHVTTDTAGRVWVTWATVTKAEIYPELTSDIPYVQTAQARAKRAPWFREARPVVRVLSGGAGVDGQESREWCIAENAANGKQRGDAGKSEPGVIEQAGHSLFPRITCTADGGVVLVVRRYGEPQNVEMNTGERRGKLRAFETALLRRGEHGWSAPEVLHQAGWGGNLAPPSVLAVEDRLLVAWQADLATRNAQSDVCVSTIEAPGASEIPLTPIPSPMKGEGSVGRVPPLPSRERRVNAHSTQGRSLGGGEGPEPGGKVFFGNIHMHTEQSFCRRQTSLLLDFNYRWAQDCMRQDFAVLTDHAETKSAYEWWLNRKTAAFFTTPAFAALLGYEWTTRFDADTGEGHGHLDVYFRGDPPRFWPANAVESSTCEGLWELLRKGEAEGYPAFTVSHHPSVNNFRRNWTRFGGDQYEPVVEIHQDRRGSFERPGGTGASVLPVEQYASGHWVSDALARGHRLGFVSGGDHMGISMTAVKANALTREAIFDAIRSRRCYAVTGAKIVLDVELDVAGTSASFGDVVSVLQVGETATVRVRVTSPSPIQRVLLVQDSQDVHEFPVSEDQSTEASMSLRVEPDSYAYVRVELMDGELAWGSPVFFTQ